jgi:predicted aspartyl protease
VIKGKVTSNGVPTISFKIADGVYRAVIDTGFNGDLELPEKLRKHFRPRLLGQATSTRAEFSSTALTIMVKEPIFEFVPH